MKETKWNIGVNHATNFNEWVVIGLDNGWCSEPVCETHEGLPMTKDEEQEWESGNDPCVLAMRIYNSPEDKAEAEEGHPVSASPFKELWENRP